MSIWNPPPKLCSCQHCQEDRRAQQASLKASIVKFELAFTKFKTQFNEAQLKNFDPTNFPQELREKAAREIERHTHS